MLFPVNIISILSDCALWADRLVRSDLIEGIIVTENDYTSNFTSAFRREVNSRNIPGLKAKIQVLNPSAERELGADACVIFQNKKEYKASIFEAKWPRLSTHVNTWDSKQKSSGKSHFHSQLTRQHHHTRYAAVWEMFYCEEEFGQQPGYFPDFGSACVWHEHALACSRARVSVDKPWLDSELKDMLESHSTDIGNIVLEICQCKKGKKIDNDRSYYNMTDMDLPHKSLIIEYKSKN